MSETRLERFARYLNVSLTGQSFAGTRENTRIIELFTSHLKHDAANFVEVTQWLSFAQTMSVNDLTYLDALLSPQTFIVGGKLSLADVVVFDAIVTSAASGLLAAAAQYKNVSRWLEHVSVLLNTPNVLFPRGPTLLPFISPFAPTPAAAATSAGPEKKADKKADKEKEKKGAESAETPKEEKSKEGKEKGDKKAKAEKAPSEVAKSGAGACPASAAPAEEDLDPSKLDIRVGIVRKCWDHPDSEKLLCEEVDIGEENVRKIGSGLRHFYKASEFEGRKVLVLSNLKERTLGGFPSHGMVLCTANADHSEVTLLVPPANSKPGDRVTFAGFSGEPAPAAQVAKKKLLEKLAPEVR
jgi:aminoacyl tRNA synthase complex-interacting multifunctional protein 1